MTLAGLEPTPHVHSWLRDHLSNHSAKGGSWKIWWNYRMYTFPAIILRKPGSNMRQKGSFPDQSDPEKRIKILILKSDQKWSWWIWSICRYWSENGSRRSKLDQKWPSKDQNKMILKLDQKWSWWIWSICRYWSENGSKRSKLDQKWPLKDQNKMIRKTTRIFDPGFLRVYKVSIRRMI